MKIRYFPDTDTLYIELADRASSSSEAVSDHLIVDFDERGKPVGVTLEHYNPDQRQQHEPDPAADHPCALTGIKTSSIKVIRRIKLFFNDFRVTGKIYGSFYGGPPVVICVDRSGELDKTFAKETATLMAPNLIFYLP